MIKVTVYEDGKMIELEFFKKYEDASMFARHKVEGHECKIEEVDDVRVYKEWCQQEGIKPCYATSLEKFKKESGLWALVEGGLEDEIKR